MAFNRFTVPILLIFFFSPSLAVAGEAGWLQEETPLAEAGEPPSDPIMDVEKMVKIILEEPFLAEQSFYYDAGFKAVGSFVIHDHRFKRTCIGYLVSDGKRLAYRFIRSLPGLGSSNDAFDIELTNIARAEYKFYKASKGFVDFYPERLSVEFFFEPKITALAADWEKSEMKFDIWNVRFARRLMGYLEHVGVRTIDKGE